jgi:hypothetical protein
MFESRAPGLTHERYTRLERLARDKRFSLLGEFVCTALKRFIILGSRCPGAYLIMHCVLTHIKILIGSIPVAVNQN